MPLLVNELSVRVPECNELYFWLRADECFDIGKTR